MALCFLPCVSAEPEKGSTAFAVEAAMIPILGMLFSDRKNGDVNFGCSTFVGRRGRLDARLHVS
jgi:hypothetical protein